MAVTPAERQLILSQVNTLAVQDLVALWRQAEQLPTGEFAQFMIDAFPNVADPYAAMAGDLAADWYDESAPDLDYRATPSGMPNVQALQESTQWALGASGDAALARLAGTLQRAVFNGARNTIVDNAARETGSRWARHASANACEFCKMLASRSVGRNATFYTSEQSATGVVGRGVEMSAQDRRDRAAGSARRSVDGSKGQFLAGGIKSRGTQKLGDKFHDHCRCTPVEIRPGQKYEAAPYVERFEAEYIAARKAAGSGDVKQILAAWRQLPTS